jgi:hypothetical protein
VKLIFEDQLVTLVPPERFGVPPFPMKLMPKTLSDNAAVVAEQFWQAHQRCLAVLFIYNLRDDRWGIGIPRQRASRDSSCWQPHRADFPDLEPTAVVIGSLQTRVLESHEAPIDAVPPVDGVHMVLCLRGTERMIYTFMRIAGAAMHVPVQVAVLDDLTGLLQGAVQRVEII